MRIDSHNHFWQFNPVRDTWIDESMPVLRRDFLPGDLFPVLHENRIDGTISVQADQSDNETRFLLKLAEKNDFVKGVVGWIDLRLSDLEEKLSGYSGNNKLCGFRHIVQSEPDDEFLIRDDFINGLKFLNQFDFTYDILIYPRQLPAAIKLVNKLPNQKFVLDHIAKPYIKKQVMEPWASQIRELASAENIYCKVSGIITEADHKKWNVDQINPYLDVVFDAFGIRKIMFGSDWPVCLLAGSYTDVIRLIEDYIHSFEKEEKDKIFGKNAMDFYGLSDE